MDAPDWLAGILGYTRIDGVDAVNDHGVGLHVIELVPTRSDGSWTVAGEQLDGGFLLQARDEESLPRAWQKFFRLFERMKACSDCKRVVPAGDENPCSPCRPCQVMFALSALRICPVCHEASVKHYRLQCGHSGCRPCLTRWERQTCPECRAPYKMNPGWREFKVVDEDSE